MILLIIKLPVKEIKIRPSTTFNSVVARRALLLHVRLKFLYV